MPARSNKKKSKSKKKSRSRRRSCPKGKIRRRSYTTKKGRYVRSSCTKDRGRKGKGPKRLPKPSGDMSLSKSGYSTKLPMHERRKALDRASRKYGTLTTLRHLNLIRNLQAYDSTAKKKMSRDVKYMKAKYAKQKN